jgi:CubicO group peptidase (beta-lactamase class C family)
MKFHGFLCMTLIVPLAACVPTVAKPSAGSPVHGEVAPGFEAVRTEFERNFVERGELGGACAVYYQGRKVVDLWGGYRDAKTRSPWQEDTLVLVYSVTKGLSAMTMAVAHSRGLLNYEEKVATYWPEFAQNGKANITVRQLLSHEAGLCVFDEPLPIERTTDLDAVAAMIARQKPQWEPGRRHGYHLSTLGFYMGELIRRVDPRHRSLGRYFQDEIAQPLGMEFYIGLPESIPDSRLAVIEPLDPAKAIFNLNKVPWPMLARMMTPNSLLNRTFDIPRGFKPNDRVTLSVELGSGNGIGQVRAIARAYGEFARGGRALGLSRETLQALEAPPSVPPEGARDEVMGFDSYYSLGFMKPDPRPSFGSSQRAYGMQGTGGSFAFGDPDAQVGFAYATNRHGYHTTDDPREKSLRDAVYRSISRLAERGERGTELGESAFATP